MTVPSMQVEDEKISRKIHQLMYTSKVVSLNNFYGMRQDRWGLVVFLKNVVIKVHGLFLH